ncbi:MAG TPA: HipA family kinase [Bryobacteraceae bacterium]|nr:HipA family kinase [Bryobacteraceae bacterium]
MRGGAQAHLIEADDGRFYVVKFQNNPQHRRILVNEMIASAFLEYLQIKSPETAIVHLDSEFLLSNPEIHIRLGSVRAAVVAGWHFGSCFPGDPAKVAVYDFVPDALLHQTANVAEFTAMLIFDKWTANADARQSIFIRARLREYAPEFADHPLRVGFVALMIDHGFLFNGPHWDFPDSPLQGLYFRPSVYARVRAWEDLQPWLDQVTHFPEQIVDRALKQIPPEWLAGDESALEALMETLMNRRKRVPELIEACARGRLNPFPNWK